MMKLTVGIRRVMCLPLLAALALSPSFLLAAKRDTSPITTKPEGREVKLFKAIEAGEIEVRLIPKDATESNLLFKNKTDKPLAIRLPEAFAGAPILAQGFCGGGMCGLMGGGGGNQGVGGGFGGGGMGMMGGFGGMMGGFMNVAPALVNVAADKVRKVKVKTVCLEHGKPDPNPRVKYKIVPIDSFTKKSGVAEICKMLGRGELSQNVAQAAAWHVANDKSWQELAAMDRVRLKRRNFVIKFFSPQELTVASRAVQEADRRAKANTPKKTLGKDSSLSNQK